MDFTEARVHRRKLIYSIDCQQIKTRAAKNWRIKPTNHRSIPHWQCQLSRNHLTVKDNLCDQVEEDNVLAWESQLETNNHLTPCTGQQGQSWQGGGSQVGRGGGGSSSGSSGSSAPKLRLLGQFQSVPWESSTYPADNPLPAGHWTEREYLFAHR